MAYRSFSRVAIVIGSNRDEGRTFQQDSIGWQEADYAKWVNERFGEKANKILAQYPWPKDADEYTGAYLAGAVIIQVAKGRTYRPCIAGRIEWRE